MEEKKGMLGSYLKTPLANFIFRGIALFLFWDLIFYPFLIPESFHTMLIGYLLSFSGAVLNVLHFDVVTSNEDIILNGMRTVHVGIPCDGIEAMGVFSCIVIAFHAKWVHKVWMIITGIIVIFLLNGARVVALAWLIATNHLAAFNINHKYLFNIILFALLLIMIYLWSSKFAVKKEYSKVD
jgi:exosortase/archaeosortase family protein